MTSLPADGGYDLSDSLGGTVDALPAGLAPPEAFELVNCALGVVNHRITAFDLVIEGRLRLMDEGQKKRGRKAR